MNDKPKFTPEEAAKIIHLGEGENLTPETPPLQNAQKVEKKMRDKIFKSYFFLPFCWF